MEPQFLVRRQDQRLLLLEQFLHAIIDRRPGAVAGQAQVDLKVARFRSQQVSIETPQLAVDPKECARTTDGSARTSAPR